jgi:type I restriction enzyme M protein
MNNYVSLVSKVWNYAHVLRDEGIPYGDYVEQITYLLFLKMDEEREDFLGQPSEIPATHRWTSCGTKTARPWSGSIARR